MGFPLPNHDSRFIVPIGKSSEESEQNIESMPFVIPSGRHRIERKRTIISRTDANPTATRKTEAHIRLAITLAHVAEGLESGDVGREPVRLER